MAMLILRLTQRVLVTASEISSELSDHEEGHNSDIEGQNGGNEEDTPLPTNSQKKPRLAGDCLCFWTEVQDQKSHGLSPGILYIMGNFCGGFRSSLVLLENKN